MPVIVTLSVRIKEECLFSNLSLSLLEILCSASSSTKRPAVGFSNVVWRGLNISRLPVIYTYFYYLKRYTTWSYCKTSKHVIGLQKSADVLKFQTWVWEINSDARDLRVQWKWVYFQDNFNSMKSSQPLSFQFALSPSDFSSSDVPEEELEEVASRGVRIMYSFPWGPEPLETLLSRGSIELLNTHKGAHSKLLVSLLLLFIALCGNWLYFCLCFLCEIVRWDKATSSELKKKHCMSLTKLYGLFSNETLC